MFRLLATTLALATLAGLGGCDDVPDPSLPNEPPIAMDDSVVIKQNEGIFILVLSNDFDIDGDNLTITATTEPANGVIENLGGTIRYTPNLYFVGSDAFSYEITDLAGFTSMANVTVEIKKRETRAIFSTTTPDGEKLYMLDSRDAATLVDLGQSLDTGELILNWAISEQLQQAILLTDADRVLTVPLDDPATPANIFEIDTTSGPVDGGLALSNRGTRAAYTLGNRYLVYLDLENVFESVEFDTGFDAGSTMTPSFFALLDGAEIFDIAVIMEGTLGTDDTERSAIYSIPLSAEEQSVILDDPDILQSTITRPLFGLNGMAWATDSATMPVAPAAYSCGAPPPQTLSALSYTLLTSPDAGTNLNVASGLLPDPTSLISYNYARGAVSVFIAACPPDADIVQIIEVPFNSASSAEIVASGDDASDGLWNIDVVAGGQYIVYVLDGDTGLRTIGLDLAGPDPIVANLTDSVPDFQTFVADSEVRLPPSVLSSDGRRWVFLAPVSDALTRLEWLELAATDEGTYELSMLDLPFTATNLLSDGLFALVQGETGDAESAPIALIDLQDPTVTPVNVPGTLAETLIDPLNQIESAIKLFAVP